MKPAPFAAIFDLDGVLFNTVPLVWQAYNRVLERYGIHLTDELIGEYEGQPLRQQLDAINATFGTNIGFDEFKLQSGPIERRLMAHVPANPGVTTLLRGLEAEGIPMAIGTSAPRATAAKLLKAAGLRQFFQVVVAEEDVERHKPNPAVFLKAAKKLRADPGHCVVFEDAPAGVSAAKTAGMRCCALSGPFTTSEDLSDADLTIDSLEHVSPAQIRALLA